MNLSLKGKTALVTGASRGIGRAICERFAGEGCSLIMVATSKERLENARRDMIEHHGCPAETFVADLSDPTSARSLARRFANVDIVVNCAGAVPKGSLLELDEAQWSEAFGLKVFGYLNMMRAFYDVLNAKGGGVIVNVIGVGGLTRTWGNVCGAAANAAVSAFTQAAGSESHKENIRIIGVSPGPVYTERMVSMHLGGDETDTATADRLFGRRVAVPDEIAAVVAFVASDFASYMSGTIVNVDLGLSRT